MKIFSKYMLIALTACFALASCGDDDEDYAPGPQDTEDRAGVYFPSENISFSQLDPTDPTEVEFKVARLNTTGELEVPIIVQINDNDAFEVPEKAVFADGESETTVKVTFPETEIGTMYKLVVTIPTELVSLYKEFDGGVSYTLQIQRIKWLDWGTGYITEYFEEFEGTLNIQKAEGLRMYRIENPYRIVLVDWYEYTDEEAAEVSDPYIEFSISKDDNDNDVVVFNTFKLYDYDYDAGQFYYGYWPSEFSSEYADYDEETKLLDEKTVQITPVYSIPGVYYWDPEYIIKFTLDGDITFNDK